MVLVVEVLGLGLEDLHGPSTRTSAIKDIGLGMIAPMREPAGEKLGDRQNKFNKQVNTIRYQFERTIANLKT